MPCCVETVASSSVHGVIQRLIQRVCCSYLPSIESVLSYLASLHIGSGGSGGCRHPDAILLDAPAVSAAAGAGSPLAAVARLRAALEEAALTVSAVCAGGRCAVLMASEPAVGGRQGRPPDRHTARLLATAPDALTLHCGTLTCHLTATQHCLLLRHVSMVAWSVSSLPSPAEACLSGGLICLLTANQHCLLLRHVLLS